MKSLHKITLAAALLCSAASASAASDVEFGEMQLDTEYTTQQYKSAEGYYIPDADGQLCVSMRNASMSFYPFEDAEHSISWEVLSHGYTDDGYAYYIDVTKGKTVYFYDSFCMTNATYVLSMNKPLATTGIWPSPENGPFSLTAGGDLQIRFNQPAVFDNVVIAANGSLVQVSDAFCRDNYFNLDVYTVVSRMMTAGQIAWGDKFTILISGLAAANDKTNLYDGTGNMALEYTLAQKPVEVVSIRDISGPFLSYFIPGSGNTSVEMTFSEPINPDRARAVLSYGDLDKALDGDFYVENLTPVFNDDNTVMTIDFAGKVRRPADMVASGMTYQSMTLSLNNLVGTDGQFVNISEVGTYGGKTFNYAYHEVESDIVAEFTPRSGSSIEGRSQLEIYVKNYDQLGHDGIRFEWPGNTVVVPKNELTFEADQDGTAILVTIPEAARSARNVTVSFENLSTPDGIDHSAALSARYNVAFSLVGSQCDPAKGTELDWLNEDSAVSMKIDKPEGLGFVLLNITDKAEPDTPLLYHLELKPGDNTGVFTGTLPYALFFYVGHTYRFEVVAYETFADFEAGNEPVGTDFIEYEGTRTAYVESGDEFESIDPAADTQIDNKDFGGWTVTINGHARNSARSYLLTEDGSKHLLRCTLDGDIITNDETGVRVADKLVYTLPADELDKVGRNVTLRIYMIGNDDYPVTGNAGTGENTHMEFNYILGFNQDSVDAIELPASDTYTVYDLRGIRVLDNATEAQVRALTPGIYVANGVKVAIR